MTVRTDASDRADYMELSEAQEAEIMGRRMANDHLLRVRLEEALRAERTEHESWTSGDLSVLDREWPLWHDLYERHEARLELLARLTEGDSR